MRRRSCGASTPRPRYVGGGHFPHRTVSNQSSFQHPPGPPWVSFPSWASHQAFGDVRRTCVDVDEVVHEVLPLATPTAHAGVRRRPATRTPVNAPRDLFGSCSDLLRIRASDQRRLASPRSHATRVVVAFCRRFRSHRRLGSLPFLPRRCVGHLLRLLVHMPGPSLSRRRELRWRSASGQQPRRAKIQCRPLRRRMEDLPWTPKRPSMDRPKTAHGPSTRDPDTPL